MLPDGAVAVADLDNHCIRLILASGGGVLTLAGRGGEEGSEDGPGAVARFSNPTSIVVVAEAGDYYLLVADYGNNKIRRISAGGFVTTYAGSGTAGGADGSGSAASFDLPYGLALGPGGVLYVTEWGGDRVRAVSPAAVVSTVAGGGLSGFADGKGAAARFNCPSGIAVDAAGVIFVADSHNHRIRRISNHAVLTLAGSGERADADGGGDPDGTGTEALFNNPRGLAIDPASGNLLVADSGSRRVRSVNPSTRAVTTVAGGSGDGGSDGGFVAPIAVAVDGRGSILVVDVGSDLVRRVEVSTARRVLFAGAVAAGVLAAVVVAALGLDCPPKGGLAARS